MFGIISEQKEIIKELEREVADLKDILVSVTHHDGALEEYQRRWEPIVRKELIDRNKVYPRQTLNPNSLRLECVSGDSY